MNYLLIGSGGREYAIAKSIKNHNRDKIHCISTFVNPELEMMCYSYKSSEYITRELVLDYCKNNEIDMVIVGSETHLKNKIPDALFEQNIPCFGPLYMYSQIELDKSYLRGLLKDTKYNPKYYVFTEFNEQKLLNCFSEFEMEYVIKYSGIYGGKGVKLSGDHLSIDNIDESLEFCKKIIRDGHKIVVEEKLIGKEFSYHSFCDGITLKHTIPIKDYKRLNNGDLGPNTGSMGAVSCSNHLLPFLTKHDIIEAQKINKLVLYNLYRDVKSKYANSIDTSILKKIIYGYRGIIYGSFIKTSTGIKVIEYNSRFGDPESINILSLLETNFIDILESIRNQTLIDLDISFRHQYSLSKYIVPIGYPDISIKKTIIILDDLMKYKNKLAFSNILYFEDQYKLLGSRAISYIDTSNNLNTLIKDSNKLLNKLCAPIHYRTDIGADILNIVCNYKESGVDVEMANEIVKNIGYLVKSTFNKNCINSVGDYSGIYNCEFIKQLKDPVLVTSIDGVGTKAHFILKLIESNLIEYNLAVNLYKSLGADIVGHSINDILVKGGQPLFLTDYVASSKLSETIILNIIEGMCDEAMKFNLPVIGGETAEMPDIYNENSYDIVGNIVGVAERDKLINGRENIKEHDVCVGLFSNSPHTNGYSLIRKLFKENNYSIEEIKNVYGVDNSFIDWLCTSHKAYLNEINILLKNGVDIHGLAHITGGGFIDNLPRVLPDDLSILLYKSSIISDNFRKLGDMLGCPDESMLKIFNCGIGFIIITDNDNFTELKRIYKENNINYRVLGRIEKYNSENRVNLF